MPSTGVGYQFQFPTPNGSASSAFGGVAALPKVGANVPFDLSGNLAVLIGPVTAGGRVTIDLPPIDFRAASVTLNAVDGGPSLFWFASEGRYPLPKGVLGTSSPQMFSFSFDGSPTTGRAMLPPGRFDGSTTSSDPNFNSFTENRSFDLEPDDDLTADFGAPALLAVRPDSRRVGRPRDGQRQSGRQRPTCAQVQVLVNGAAATVAADGSFSARAVIGTGSAHDRRPRLPGPHDHAEALFHDHDWSLRALRRRGPGFAKPGRQRGHELRVPGAACQEQLQRRAGDPAQGDRRARRCAGHCRQRRRGAAGRRRW